MELLINTNKREELVDITSLIKEEIRKNEIN